MAVALDVVVGGEGVGDVDGLWERTCRVYRRRWGWCGCTSCSVMGEGSTAAPPLHNVGMGDVGHIVAGGDGVGAPELQVLGTVRRFDLCRGGRGETGT